jgi:hypothetical protein
MVWETVIKHYFNILFKIKTALPIWGGGHWQEKSVTLTLVFEDTDTGTIYIFF